LASKFVYIPRAIKILYLFKRNMTSNFLDLDFLDRYLLFTVTDKNLNS